MSKMKELKIENILIQSVQKDIQIAKVNIFAPISFSIALVCLFSHQIYSRFSKKITKLYDFGEKYF